MTFLTKRYTLRCLHKLTAEKVPAEDRVWHGHNYQVEVTLCGQTESETGWLFSRDLLDEIVGKHLIEPYDRSNLNDHFATTTGEVLCYEFLSILLKTEIASLLYSIQIQETGKNRFQCLRKDVIAKEPAS